jgi:hypothetical protein
MHEALQRADKRVVVVVLTAALLVGVSGCGGGAPGKGTSTAPIGRPQAATLHLAAGRSAAQFMIVAPPPPKYTWNASVAAPAAADVGVNIRTWYGVDLQVLTSTHDAESCKTGARRSTCFTRFPFLEAQRAGRWTVIATKRSGPPAVVHIAITFNKP